MRPYLLALALLGVAGSDRAKDREALLAADRARSTARDVLAAFADDARYLEPGAPLVRGKSAIHADAAAVTPVFADVSDDGSLGYSYGWLTSGDQQGKYLACWRRRGSRAPWRIVAYAHTALRPATGAPADTASPPGSATPVRGLADAHQLISADSAFAALSVAQGAQAAFLAYAAEEAVTLGGPGAAMNRGRDAIGAAFADFPPDAVLAWTPVAAEIATSGDLGCTVGEAAITARHVYSKYLTIWKRQPGGAWRFVMDGGNARPAP